MLKTVLIYFLWLLAWLMGSHYIRLLVVGKVEDGMQVIRSRPHLPTLGVAFVLCLVSALLMYFLLPFGWQSALAQIFFWLAVVVMNVAMWRFALNRAAIKRLFESSTDSEQHNP